MSATAMRILAIGQDLPSRRRLRDALAGLAGGSFIVERAARLVDGLERLRSGGISAIVLDRCSPDGTGVEAVDQVARAAPLVPMLVIGSLDEPDDDRDDIKRGVRDFLREDRVDRYSLSRALSTIIKMTAAEEALFFEWQRAEVISRSIGDAVLSIDWSGTVIEINPVGELVTGWSREDALRRPLSEVFQVVDPTTREPLRHPIDGSAVSSQAVGAARSGLLIRRDGLETAIGHLVAVTRNRAGQPTGALIIFKDLTETEASSRHALYLTQHDVLTDLPNRLLLTDRLTQAIGLARRHGLRLAVLVLDLDQFRHVNDSLGHVMGDRLLQLVAARLVASVRGSDTVSREGGDEFMVLLSEIDHPHDAASSAQKIVGALTAPHDVGDHQLHITFSIGISVYPDDGLDAETLVKCADIAMNHAKNSGRNKYQFFERDMNARAVERQWIEARLHPGLARGEFVLHYQPKIDLETGSLTGAEALIRWSHPERGLMFPKDFVSIAEDCGLIVPIGRWVMREACRQARAWIDEGRRPLTVAVNVSGVEFRDRHFLAYVRSILQETRLEAPYLELELTEGSLIKHTTSTALVLRELKAMGVQVAIDDFGTGFSGLSYLRQFPVNALKIDQSFVREITSDPVGTAIIGAVISMGKSLGHRVIAEGVETSQQLAFLRAQHCGEGQGYYFSRPVAAEQFVDLGDAGLLGAAVQ